MYRSDILPSYGMQIRVSRGLYYHHGIYISDDEVIHFASLEPGHETDPQSASVVKTSLAQFLRGGVLECREYSEDEKSKVRSPLEIVEYANANLGKKGYDIVKYNCEHFSNECAFGTPSSEQVDNVFSFLSGLFR